MNKYFSWFIILVLIIILAGFVSWREQTPRVNEPVNQPEAIVPEAETTKTKEPTTTTMVSDREITVKHTANGYSPSITNIKTGTTVIFQNENDEPNWPASARHPTHTVYPTTGGCLGSTFDACKNIAKGESWSFKFDIPGTWKFHNHLNPTQFGTINVE